MIVRSKISSFEGKGRVSLSSYVPHFFSKAAHSRSVSIQTGSEARMPSFHFPAGKTPVAVDRLVQVGFPGHV